MEEKTSQEDTMHGSMFVLLKRFIEGLYDYSTWVNLLKEAGIAHAPYQMDGVYPTGEMAEIVGAASRLTGIPSHELMESYGQALVPDLLLVCSKYVQPEWRTYKMLLNTEFAMHVAVGIIRGIAKYFHESDLVEVTLLTPAHEERVQIRVEFLR